MAETEPYIEESQSVPTKEKKKRIRFEWLDQFRGLVIILFVVQTIAWIFSGNPSEGIMPVLAPHLNHGYKYANFADMPPIITLIDLGQSIFIFLVGLMQAFSIMKMKSKNAESKQIWIHIVKRYVLITILSTIHIFIGDGFDAYKIFVSGTLAQIGLAGLVTGIISMLIDKADLRFYIGVGIMALHMVLYAFFAEVDKFPFGPINHIAVALVASAYCGWFFKGDGSVDESNLSKRILPVTMGCFGWMYILEFIQWADHHGITTPTALMAIGVSGIAIYMFYKMDQDGYHAPFLTALGKNMLMIFLLSMVINELIYVPMIEDLVRQNAFLDMILAGILPLFFMWAIAKLLEKLNIYIKV